MAHGEYSEISRIATFRSSHQCCSVKKGVLKIFTKFTGNHLCQGLFFNKVASLSPATLLKKGLWHKCFPVNFVKLLRTLFYRTPLNDCFCTFHITLERFPLKNIIDVQSH